MFAFTYVAGIRKTEITGDGLSPLNHQHTRLMVTQNGTGVRALLTETMRKIILKKGKAEKTRNEVGAAVRVLEHRTATGRKRDGNHHIPIQGPSKCK
jgi:hypothetical protein